MHRQGYVHRKFKESKKFVGMVKEIGISKSAITFTRELYKLLKKFSSLKKMRNECSILKITFARSN